MIGAFSVRIMGVCTMDATTCTSSNPDKDKTVRPLDEYYKLLHILPSTLGGSNRIHDHKKITRWLTI